MSDSSTKSLISETSNQNSIGQNLKESREIILILIKITSCILLVVTFIFQLEFFLYFILNLITKNNYITIFLIFFFHFILLRYIVQSFLYILQCPILKSICFYSISCNQLRDLLNVSIEFTNLYKSLKGQNKAFDQNDVLLINDISKVINAYLNFFKEFKIKGEISKDQNDLYEKLCLWMKNYEEYKKKNFIDLKEENDKIKNEKKNFIYFLRQMFNNSNEIIKIVRNFNCDNYEALSFKRIYNCFINNTFSSLNQFSITFSKRFNSIYNSFITSDNKVIDYTIISYDKLFKNNNFSKKFNYEKEGKRNIKKNLLIFCNPNGMLYQLYTPEKFLSYLQGGCEILLWNYRGYGSSSGYPTFKNAKSDVIELFDYIKKKGQYNKYGALGYSVGGGCATFLCQNRNLDVLICDRNFTCLADIARDISVFGEFLYYLSKMLCFKYDYNASEFIKSKNKNIRKIVLCDPDDEVIPNSASLKSGISKYIIKSYCIENNLRKTENILDLFLNVENNSNQKNKFIESLLYIMNILDEFNKNPFKDLIDKKNKSNKKEDKLDKSLLLNINDNMEINNKNFRKKFINTIVKFFKCFNYSSENLEDFKEIEEKRLKIIHIDSYFNNFFIWGSISSNKIMDIDGFKNPFDIKNNSYYLNKAIDYLNEFLNDKFIKSMLGEENNKVKYNNLMNIKNCFQILKNKNEFIMSVKNFNIGALIRLDCGHNGLESEVDKRNLIDILKDADFIN